MKNIEGLARDCYTCMEYYNDINKAKKHVIREFSSEYTEKEIEEVFQSVIEKNFLSPCSQART